MIKADFKQIRALQVGLALMAADPRPETTIINIDCSPGPGAPGTVFDRRHVQQIERAAPGAVISLGMRTRWFGRVYERSHVDTVSSLIDSTSAPVTVAVRVEQALRDPTALEPLLDRGVVLTLWNSALRNPATPDIVAELRDRWPNAWLDLSS